MPSLTGKDLDTIIRRLNKLYTELYKLMSFCRDAQAQVILSELELKLNEFRSVYRGN